LFSVFFSFETTSAGVVFYYTFVLKKFTPGMTEQPEITILFQDEHLLVVDKPTQLPTHKSEWMPHDAPYLTKVLGQQLGCSIYNVHRLDAKTSGVMMVALTPDIARVLTEQFAGKMVRKSYQAIVKGCPGDGVFDRKVKKAKHGNQVNAETEYRTLQTVTTDIDHKGQTAVQLSLMSLIPLTGRWHQLRQHCSQAWHDILGDSQHGDWGLNHIIEERTGVKRLYLHACELGFTHPVTQVPLDFQVPLPTDFEQVLSLFP